MELCSVCVCVCVCVCVSVHTCMHAVAQRCLILCNLMDYSPEGSSVHGITPARILEWVAISTPGDRPDPGNELTSPALQMDSLPRSHLGSPHEAVNCPNLLTATLLRFSRQWSVSPESFEKQTGIAEFVILYSNKALLG